VAVAAVHRRFGPLSAGDVQTTSVQATAPGRWRIELAVPRAGLDQIAVQVAASRRAPAQLTCRAAAETPATAYRVVDLSTG
jgi:hypothetical protein